MDYIQEDVDAMQNELQLWHSENKQHAEALQKEQRWVGAGGRVDAAEGAEVVGPGGGDGVAEGAGWRGWGWGGLLRKEQSWDPGLGGCRRNRGWWGTRGKAVQKKQRWVGVEAQGAQGDASQGIP